MTTPNTCEFCGIEFTPSNPPDVTNKKHRHCLDALACVNRHRAQQKEKEAA